MSDALFAAMMASMIFFTLMSALVTTRMFFPCTREQRRECLEWCLGFGFIGVGIGFMAMYYVIASAIGWTIITIGFSVFGGFMFGMHFAARGDKWKAIVSILIMTAAIVAVIVDPSLLTLPWEKK